MKMHAMLPFAAPLVRGTEPRSCLREDRGPPSGVASVVGCTDRASQPGRICRNVIDVDETPIKITIADTVMTARLADNATARDPRPTSAHLDLQRLQPRREDRDTSSAAVDGRRTSRSRPRHRRYRLLRSLGRPGLLLRRRRLLERHRPHRPIRHTMELIEHQADNFKVTIERS